MQRKEKTKVIEEILGTYLKEREFHFTGYNRDIDGWLYEKEKNGITQRVMVYEYCSGLRLHLNTDGYMQGDLLDSFLIPKEKCRLNALGFWGYKTAEEFRGVVTVFKEALENRGLEELDKMSCHKTEIRPTPERELYLYQNHEELNKTMREKLGISLEETDIDIMGELLHEELVKRKDGGVEIIPDLIGLSAVYGDTLVKGRHWEWTWDEKQKKCRIRIQYILHSPLSVIFTNWYNIHTGFDSNQTIEDLRYNCLKTELLVNRSKRQEND